MKGKFYFNCDKCEDDKMKTGELQKQILDFEKKEITLQFKCDTCKEETQVSSPMPKETVFR